MKKLTLVFALLFVSILTYATTVEKVYYFENPVVKQNRGFSEITFNGTLQSALAGQPSLPWQSISLLLPEGEKAVAIEIIPSDFQEVEGSFQLFPYQSSRPLSANDKAEFQQDMMVYSSKEIYPAQNHGQLTTSYLNGFGFAFSAFTPVQYIPSTGKVSYATKVTVRITTESDEIDRSSMLWLNPAVERRIKKLAQNPAMIDTYASKAKSVAGYDLLVITPEPYVESFGEYVNYYNSIGVRTQVVAKETITSQTTGSDEQEKIRNYIIDQYQNEGILMVVLGGDVDLIPYRGFYCYVQSGGGYTEDGIPADLYYSGLDGTWNDDNDNNWGEIGEDDLLPEVGVSRFPFGNETELQNMIHKTLTYQQSPVLGEFRHPLLAGESLYSGPDTWGKDYLDLLIGTHDDNGYTTVGIPDDYDIETMYEYDNSWSGNNLMAKINQGLQFVHHVGHANQTYVAHMYDSEITSSNFSGSNGIDHNYTFFHTHGCDCGAFDYGDCILERMVLIENFAVAVMGNSRYGWFNEGQTEGPSCHLHREMTDAFYNDKIQFVSLAMVESKTLTAPWVTAPGQWEEGALRWNFYDLNILGDGTVSPWLDEPFVPEVEYPSEIVVGTQTIDVAVSENGSPLSNFRCSVVIENETVAFGVTDENGEATLTFEPQLTTVAEGTLIVTGCNAYPQQLPILVLPGDVPFVVYESYSLDDASGNGNGEADYGESLLLNLNVRNVGLVDASNVTVSMSCEETEYVTITDNSAQIETILANEIVILSNEFAFDLSNDVPDGTILHFVLTCTDGTNTWTSDFNIAAKAPDLTIGSYSINDEQGNNNGQLDPGENANIIVGIINQGGSVSPNMTLTVSSNNPDVVVVNSSLNLEALNIGQTIEINIELNVSSSAEDGSVVDLCFDLNAGSYSTEKCFSLSIGIRQETFETGNFNAYEWHFEGNSPWIITSTGVYEGAYCAQSGVISGNQSSELKINVLLSQSAPISFYKKVSSEENYDYLRFYIDNTKKGEWSGEMDWSLTTVEAESGMYYMRWVYEKDYSVENGNDCAWIDNVVFPAGSIIVGVDENSATISVNIYPNPNNGLFNIDLSENDNYKLTIFNTLGQLVYVQDAISGHAAIDVNHLQSGVYVISIENETERMISRFVKK